MNEAAARPTIEGVLVTYDRLITSTIVKYAGKAGRHLTKDDIDDLRQSVFTRMVQTNYLERYDPKKGALTTYLYWLTRTVVINAMKRKYDPLRKAVAFVTRPRHPDRGWQADPRTTSELVLETFEDLRTASFERVQMAKDLADKLAAHIQEQEATTPGLRAPLSQVLAFVRDGKEPGEIATSLGISGRAVSGHLKRLREEAAAFMPSAVNAW